MGILEKIGSSGNSVGNKVDNEESSPLPRWERGGGEGESSITPLTLSLSHQGRGNFLHRALRQRGQALLLALLVLGVAGGAVLFSYYRSATLTLESDQKTTDALALVKTALIGWTAKRGDSCTKITTTITDTPSPGTVTIASTTSGTTTATNSNNIPAGTATWVTCTGTSRPGDFPCPDTDNDGIENSTSCLAAAGRLGRVPWKTLGIPEPKDSAGETLWYAVAGPFRARKDSNNNNLNNSGIINSNTQGNITVYDADGTVYDADGTTPHLLADGSTLQTPKGAVAVILAPGRAIGTQIRDATIASCATTGTSIARNLCAANYLETGPNDRKNWSPDDVFINGKLSATFNDRLVYLTTPEFMPAVEKRVATEVKAWLDGYRANSICQCYPWAADFDITASGTTPNYDTQSEDGVNRGRFPVKDGDEARPENWTTSSTSPRPTLSNWFTYNNWNIVIYYALARQNAENQGVSCTTCTGATLSVDGKPVISAIFFTPGTPLGSINRTSSSTRNVLANYLRDAANNDGADDTYVNPTATALDRNRLYTSISAPAAWDASQQCEDMGEALRDLTPCGVPPKLNSQCSSLAGTDSNGAVLTPAQGLQVCSAACANAARVVVNVPCQNTNKPSVCRNARNTLEDDC